MASKDAYLKTGFSPESLGSLDLGEEEASDRHPIGTRRAQVLQQCLEGGAGLFLTLECVGSLASLSQKALTEEKSNGGKLPALDTGSMDAQEKGAGEEPVQIWDKRQDIDVKPSEDDSSSPRCGEKGSAEDAKAEDAAGAKGEEGDEDSSVPFSEILNLVQTGQEIPGLQKLNINATQESPTASQMPRRSKPWETTV